MQTSDVENAGQEHSSSKTSDTRNVSKVKVLLTPSQHEFIDFVLFFGVRELSNSLKMIHDLALYHSDIPVTNAEKGALYNLKLLWEGFERIGEEM